jgi:hypothetical protein
MLHDGSGNKASSLFITYPVFSEATMRILCYCFICFALSAGLAFADATGSITYLNRWPTAAPNVMAKVGNYVFYGDGEAIAVFDDTTAPALTPVARVGIRLTPAEQLGAEQAAGTEGISGLYFANGFLYVTCGNEGLQIYQVPPDPADFSAQNWVGTHLVEKGNNRASVRDVAVSGQYAYIGYHWLSNQGYDSGIRVVDVSDPANPVMAGEAELPTTWAELKRVESLALSGGYAYVTDMYNGLVIFDLADPVNPAAEAVCYIPSAMDVAVSGGYAYFTCVGYGLQVVNIDPAQFTDNLDVIQTVAFSQYNDSMTKAVSIEARGDFAYVGDVDLGLVIVDISSPEDINDNSLVAYYNNDAEGVYRLSLDPVNPVVYVGDCRKGLQKIDVSNPAAPARTAAVEDTQTPADADAIIVDPATSYIFTADDDATVGGVQEGIRIFFAILSEDYVSFLFKGMFPTDGEASDVYLANGYLYVADGSAGLKIIDPGLPAATAGPVNPSLKGSCGITGTANGVFVLDGYAYVAAGDGGLKVVDISDPALPIQVGELAGTAVSDARKVMVKADYAFVADGWNGLKIVDISNKTQPFLTGSYWVDDTDDLDDIPGCVTDVDVVGVLAYIATNNEGFYVMDVSDTYNPKYLADYSANPYEQVKGLFAARSDQSEGVDLVWVANGTAPDDNMGFFLNPSTVPPQRSTAYHTSGDVKDVFVVGEYAYLADSAGGFQVLAVTEGDADDGTWDDDVVPVDTHRSKSGGCFIRMVWSGLSDGLSRLTSLFR